MAQSIRSHALESRTQRLKLAVRRKPYDARIGPGVRLGYRRTATSGSWSVIVADGAGGSWMRRFALADDFEDSDQADVLTFFEAQRRALAIARKGPDGDGIATVDVERQIADKAKAFLEQGIEPVCYLYRHYHPNGDLLYVGISLEPYKRQGKHLKDARWRHMIHRILIEPFTSREEALDAEQTAIRNEFPRFNGVHNGRRHPVQELRVRTPTPGDADASDQSGVGVP